MPESLQKHTENAGSRWFPRDGPRNLHPQEAGPIAGVLQPLRTCLSGVPGLSRHEPAAPHPGPPGVSHSLSVECTHTNRLEVALSSALCDLLGFWGNAGQVL